MSDEEEVVGSLGTWRGGGVWHAAGPLAALLFIGSGAVTVLSVLLPAPEGQQVAAVAGLGATALLVGLVLLRLPWDRWSPIAGQAILPLALALIALHNHLGGVDPYRYAVFFVVAFMWVGLTQPRWTSVCWSGPLLVAYAAPLAASSAPSWAWSSMLYSVSICLLVAETLAYTVERLRLAERRFRMLVRHAPSHITVLDRDGVITFESEQASQLIGADRTAASGRSALDDVHPDDVERATRTFLRVLDRSGASASCEIRTRATTGWRWAEVTFTNLLDEPSVDGVVANWRDVTDRHDLEQALTALAYTDVLTALPNRVAFQKRLRAAVSRAGRIGSSVAVLFLDLDGLKAVNDSLGHAAGDDLLQQAAERMLALRRQSEVLARMGGDEFVLLLEDVRSPADADAAAARMRAAFTEPFVLSAGVVHAGASVGLAFANGDDADAVLLMRQADEAMYEEKHGRPGRDLTSA